jgi:outer membrane protein
MSVQVPFRKILLGALASAALSVPAMAEIKIGVVDYARLLEQSPQAKALQDSLKNEFGPRYQQLLAQDQQLKTRADKLQKDAATMSQEQRDKEEKSLRDAARELERKKTEWQDDSNTRRNEEMNKLQRSLIGEVRDYAKGQSFDIVIAEGVIYSTPTVDITAAVLQALQSRAPKPAAAPAAPATGNPAPAKPPAKP